MNINMAVKEHEVTEIEWRFQELANNLHIWIERFNETFFEGKLPTPFLTIDRGSTYSLGHYRNGFNGIGAKFTININTLYAKRGMQNILCACLHEMAHLWQEIYGQPSPWNYHNKQYRDKVASFGIPCSEKGSTTRVTKPFIDILSKYGVDAIVIQSDDIEPVRKKGASKLKKWSCGCQNARVAIPDFQASCRKCGNDFELMK